MLLFKFFPASDKNTCQTQIVKKSNFRCDLILQKAKNKKKYIYIYVYKIRNKNVSKKNTYIYQSLLI